LGIAPTAEWKLLWRPRIFEYGRFEPALRQVLSAPKQKIKKKGKKQKPKKKP
jgi:hypothetical protein